jgi:hypothetical protein
LTYLLIYALSFFKAPLGITSSMESLLIKFFLEGGEDLQKTSWISWKIICLRKEHVGLGVRQLREFNLALLGKWCWRMFVDRWGLWFRVLVARYGVERGGLQEGGRRASSWWRQIATLRDGVGGAGGGWFGEGVESKVGDGSDTFFWTESWLDGILLIERFRHLYDLSDRRSSSMAEMATLGWQIGRAAWV